ncbi:MAG: diaminopimelate decarboxylase [Ignavibacteriales bacterium]|jgi:diaminopimelate decarboxylase|nr:MAG: diaminopimelate decarboxylase [Ignavibacteriaceae bacterium]MBW7872691.1 diaminopimelate decarboxylase [Ignavibacteria bacterium]MCZ2143412.1 diaminopimelate decarboxylase [Ignavibacteriales bacterium]MBV6444291.1 Diaminopimelate decarboxylase [Ignavibacteriaceae bacterium]MBZ0197792.1 diaminopimelate decarboxylase [Ignavibacteriaceae bacterium]
MQHFEDNYWHYKENKLYCEDTSIEEIIAQTDTPAYIYSKASLIKRCREFTSAFESVNHKVFYAVKANSNLNVIRIIYDQGFGLDVNSAGEFYRAIKAGATPDRMIMTGVAKTREEIKLAVENEVLMIKAESLDEVKQINETAGLLGKKARVALRVNPDIVVQTHPNISTAKSGVKFGMDPVPAMAVYLDHASYPNIEFTGIDVHLGSQILSFDPYFVTLMKLHTFISKLADNGVYLKHIDLGGGFGSPYHGGDKFNIKAFGQQVAPLLNEFGCEIFFEPGRFLTANSGAIISRVLYTKTSGNKNILLLDASMTEIMRPMLYQSYHSILPVLIEPGRDKIVYDVVGPVCESSDYLAKGRESQEAHSGDLMAIMSAGAYASVMSSNYNVRRKPPEIIVTGSEWFVARGRESYDFLLYDEHIIEDLVE